MATITQTSATATGAFISAAQINTTPSSSSSSRLPQVHTVKVGAGGFKFEPQELQDINVGDTVTFEFYPPDHSVTRAEFGSACIPYEYTGKGKIGFWSDTQNVTDFEHLTYYNVTINTTEPIFYYCAAPNSCTGYYMVGVINPNFTQTLDKQIVAAKDAPFQVKPGDPIPAEGTTTVHTTPTTVHTYPATVHTYPTASPSAAPESHNHSLSVGAIAGIAIGGVAFLVLCAALFYVGCTKGTKEVIKHRKSRLMSPTPGADTDFPQSRGYPRAAPLSPNMQHAEAWMGDGGQILPPYGHHNATNSWYGVVPPQQQELPHLQNAGVKQPYPTELASWTPGQQEFAQELEAPYQAPR